MKNSQTQQYIWKEKNSKLEHRLIEIIQAEEQKEKWTVSETVRHQHAYQHAFNEKFQKEEGKKGAEKYILRNN